MLEGYITVSEAARRAGYSEYWIRDLCRAGRLECARVGHSVMVAVASVDGYKERMTKLGTHKHSWKRDKTG